jgi:hypothetical protein
MDCAGAGRHEQCAAVVLVQEAFGCPPVHVADRIGDEPVDAECFGGDRQNLQQQRIAGVATAHPSHVTARNFQLEIPSRRHGRQDQRGIQIEQGAQLAGVGHRIG